MVNSAHLLVAQTVDNHLADGSIATDSSVAEKGYNSVDIRRLSYFQYVDLRLGELPKFRYALKNAVLSNLRRRYRRSTLGFCWSLLNPFFTMGILALIFGTIFHQNYQTFSVYVFSALLPWNFIAQVMLQGTESLANNESSLRRLVLPKMFFPLVTVCTEMVNFVLSLASFLALGLLFGQHYSYTILLLPFAALAAGILCFGLAICMSILTVYWRDTQHILGVVVQLLFYTIPIIYPVETLSNNLKLIVHFNPFYHFVKLFRYAIYFGQCPALIEWCFCFVVAVISMAIALWMLKRTERELLFRL